MNFDFSSLEARILGVLDHVDTDVEGVLHAPIAHAIVAAGQALLPLIPEGAAVESVLAKLDELATEAHNVIVAHEQASVTSEATPAPAEPTEPATEPEPAPDAPAASQPVVNEAGTVLPPQ